MKNVFLLFISILSFTLLSCQDDMEDRGVQINENGFQLAYTVPSLETITRSAVSVEEGEDRINTFYALFFEHTSGGADLFLTAIDLMEGREGSFSSSGVLTIDYSSVPGLTASEDYNILLCANIEAYHSTIGDLAGLETVCLGRTEAEVNSLLQIETGQVMDMTNLPMSASVVKQGKQNQVSVNLTRAVSRFDVVNQAEGYELVSASLWNVYTSTLLWDNSEENFSGNRTEQYYNVEATGNKIIGGLYGFENFVETPEMYDALTTALIVEMKKGATGSSEFFRINIHPEDKSQQLTRNNIYCSTIQEVFGSGFTSEKEAYESDPGLLAVNINGWVGVSNGSLVYDDKNTLALPASVITLAMAGDTRTYNIFTDGEGALLMTRGEGIPNEVKVNLVEDKVTIDAPVSSQEWSGLLTFSIGNLTASMRIEQREYNPNYLSVNYDVTELPALDYEAGAVSEDIEVISSGAWKARLYGENYFSFSATEDLTEFEGGPGTNLNIYTRAENKTTGDWRGFVIFTLEEDPEITRVMVIEQAKYAPYVRFVKEGTKAWPAVGGPFENLILESNADWEITGFWCISHPGYSAKVVYLDDDGKVATGLKGKGTKRLRITLDSNMASDARAQYMITASTLNTTPKDSDGYLISQLGGYGNGSKPDPEPEPTDRAMWFVTHGSGNGNLATPSSDGYKQYVYRLGENMRNSAKFGNGSSVANIGKDGFKYSNSLNSANIDKAKVIQLMDNPTSSNFDRIYKAMQEDPTVFLMITSEHANTVNSILAAFEARANAGYGKALQLPANPPENRRPVNQNVTHLLMTSLLNGTTASQVNLQGALKTSAGLASNAYPSTFIPVIMSNSSNNYCVFGIDPTHRLIIMTEPGLFGPASQFTAYPSSQNFSSNKAGNLKFLDNLTAWIYNATGKKGFLKDYQKSR